MARKPLERLTEVGALAMATTALVLCVYFAAWHYSRPNEIELNIAVAIGIGALCCLSTFRASAFGVRWKPVLRMTAARLIAARLLLVVGGLFVLRSVSVAIHRGAFGGFAFWVVLAFIAYYLALHWGFRPEYLFPAPFFKRPYLGWLLDTRAAQPEYSAQLWVDGLRAVARAAVATAEFNYDDAYAQVFYVLDSERCIRHYRNEFLAAEYAAIQGFLDVLRRFDEQQEQGEGDRTALADGASRLLEKVGGWVPRSNSSS